MSDLKKIVDQFLEEFHKFNFDQIAIRDPPSKHQRELRKLIDLVKAFEYNIRRDEGNVDEF